MDQNNNQFGVEFPVDTRLDADAVCAQCGTVNPEETLICKTCGNNLRDQRAMRLAADNMLGGTEQSASWWLRPAFTLLGVLIIIWVALNVSRIEQWLVEIQSPAAGATGLTRLLNNHGDTMEAMMTDISGPLPTPARLKTLINAPAISPNITGKYALVSNEMSFRPVLIGVAKVEQVNGVTFFVAKLRNGGEVRGIAQDKDSHFLVQWGDAYYVDEYNEISFSGVAKSNGDGTLDCFGQSSADNESYNFIAYRMP